MLTERLQSFNKTFRGVLSSRYGIVFAIAVALLILALMFSVTKLASGTGEQNESHQGHNSQQHENHQQYGKTSNNAPSDGQHPSTQKQASLASVASSPNGGSQPNKPASGVTGNRAPINPASVLPDAKATGVLSSGCVVGYGKPGAQCLPARAAGNKPVTCADVHKQFPGGIAVTGSDQLRLDSNGDRIACGVGD